jgi:hypothetical protein
MEQQSEAADGSERQAMKTIQTLTDPGMFRTDRLPAPPVRVDRKANVIFGASLMQVGDLNDAEARPWTVDVKTLDQALNLSTRSPNGLKARFTHPNMSADGMGSYLGRWKNLRIDGDTLRGDLHIADAAFTSPQGDLGNYVMDLAESDPEAFGVSLATKLDQANLQQFASANDAKPKAERGMWPMRFQAIKAGDVVDDPAATRGGMFSLDADLRDLPAQATALLSTYFGDAQPDVVRGRIASFLDRYFASKGEQPMADETEPQAPSETPEQPEQPAVETQPVADLSAVVAVPEIVTSSTADLAQIERDRCKKIRALCDMAGHADKFNTFVDAGFSVEETQSALKDLMGKRGNVLGNAPEPPADPNAKYRAEFAAHKSLLSVSEDQYIRSRRIDDGLEPLQK